MKKTEPVVKESSNYNSDLARALSWYHSEVDRKEARGFLRNYFIHLHGRDILTKFDKISEKEIVPTFGWIARLVINGSYLTPEHKVVFDNYLNKLINTKNTITQIPAPVKVDRPSIQDSIKEKTKEHIGELEHLIDLFISTGKDIDLKQHLIARSVASVHNESIANWIKLKAGEFISVYESKDADIKEGYSNLNKRKLTGLIKLLGSWLESLNLFQQHKKANRKPRKKKIVPPAVQAAKLKYLKKFEELGLESINPVDIVGASQVWLYNTKYRRLSVYRTGSSQGLQIKNTSLQNYDPDMCEQKSVREPGKIISSILSAGKVKLRQILSELKAKDIPVTGRVHEETIILRVIK